MNLSITLDSSGPIAHTVSDPDLIYVLPASRMVLQLIFSSLHIAFILFKKELIVVQFIIGTGK